MYMGKKLTVLWDEGELGNSVMLFTCSCCCCCPFQGALPTQCRIGDLVLFKIGHEFNYIFLTTANQNKLISFFHVLYPCHWSIKGDFPTKIDQSLVFPPLVFPSVTLNVYARMFWKPVYKIARP